MFQEILLNVSSKGKETLSQREVECLTWAALGKSSWEIGKIMGLSADTINYHMKHAMRKLEASSRIEAVAKSVKLGLIEPWPEQIDAVLPIVAFLAKDWSSVPSHHHFRSLETEKSDHTTTPHPDDKTSLEQASINFSLPEYKEARDNEPNGHDLSLHREGPDSEEATFIPHLVLSVALPISIAANSIETDKPLPALAENNGHAYFIHKEEAAFHHIAQGSAGNPLPVQEAVHSNDAGQGTIPLHHIIHGSQGSDVIHIDPSNTGTTAAGNQFPPADPYESVIEIIALGNGAKLTGHDQVIFDSLRPSNVSYIIQGFSTSGANGDADTIDIGSIFDDAHIVADADIRASLVHIDSQGHLSLTLNGKNHLIATLVGLTSADIQAINNDLHGSQHHLIDVGGMPASLAGIPSIATAPLIHGNVPVMEPDPQVQQHLLTQQHAT